MALKKTALGLQVMKDRSVSLTPQQRSALILVDGNRGEADVIKMTAAVGVTAKDLEALAELGLIERSEAVAVSITPINAPPASTITPSATTATESAPSTEGVDFNIALNAAISFCADLGFKGFGLNMALTGVDSLEKLQKLAPDIRKAAGDKKYAQLHGYIFGKPL